MSELSLNQKEDNGSSVFETEKMCKALGVSTEKEEATTSASAHKSTQNGQDELAVQNSNKEEGTEIAEASESEVAKISLEILRGISCKKVPENMEKHISRHFSKMLSFDLDATFESVYLAELYRCGLLAGKDGFDEYELKFQMIQLWSNFAIKFTKKFFVDDLNLTEKGVAIGYHVSDEAAEGEKWTAGMDFEKNMKSKRASSDPCDVQEAETLRSNCQQLELPPCTIMYQVRQLLLTSPLWKTCETAQNCGEDTVEFSLFGLDVLIKMDSRMDEDGEGGRPFISFVIQPSHDKSELTDNRRVEYADSINLMLEKLKVGFPAHQQYHLSKWLEEGKLDCTWYKSSVHDFMLNDN